MFEGRPVSTSVIVNKFTLTCAPHFVHTNIQALTPTYVRIGQGPHTANPPATRRMWYCPRLPSCRRLGTADESITHSMSRTAPALAHAVRSILRSATDLALYLAASSLRPAALADCEPGHRATASGCSTTTASGAAGSQEMGLPRAPGPEFARAVPPVAGTMSSR